MYRGFNLNLNWDDKDDKLYFEIGNEMFERYSTKIRKTLKDFVLDDETLDATKMQTNWFPMINADVFISHSHKDRKRAIALAGWLYDSFKLKVFIDSCVWGYADDLLKLIDNTHCYDPITETYNYKLRNYSTSHVHLMLTTALNMMIDNSECVFFLNTPNSITTTDIINKTESPWIYAELLMTQLIRKQTPNRDYTKFFSKGIVNENLRMKYETDLSHLIKIDVDTLNVWIHKYNKKNDFKTFKNYLVMEENTFIPLDFLYELKPLSNNYIVG